MNTGLRWQDCGGTGIPRGSGAGTSAVTPAWSGGCVLCCTAFLHWPPWGPEPAAWPHGLLNTRPPPPPRGTEKENLPLYGKSGEIQLQRSLSEPTRPRHKQGQEGCPRLWHGHAGGQRDNVCRETVEARRTSWTTERGWQQHQPAEAGL